MYAHVVKTVSNAASILKRNRHTFEIAALIYIQGESDSKSEANLADERLSSLLSNLQQDLPNAKSMRLVIGGIAAAGGTRNLVREKQQRLATAHPSVSYVDNLDLQSKLYDKLHFDKEAKLIIGRRIADQLLVKKIVQTDFGKLVFLGDSITQGSHEHPSYRYQVFKRLVDANARFQFVGSVTGPQGTKGNLHKAPKYKGHEFNNRHDGHYGWRAFWVNGRTPLPSSRRDKNRGEGTLQNWLGAAKEYDLDHQGNKVVYPDSSAKGTGSTGASYVPDTAVILLGINDIADGSSATQVKDDLAVILEQLQTTNSQIRIFLCSVLHTDQGEARKQIVDELNSLLDVLAKSASTGSSPVFRIDTCTGFEPSRMTYDKVHPNDDGERYVGDKIAAGMGLVVEEEFRATSIDRPIHSMTGKNTQELFAGFEAHPAGTFKKLETNLGIWIPNEGQTVINATHARSSRKCLQLTGGKKTSVTLLVSDKARTTGNLEFWAERWTSNSPFSFRIEKSSDGASWTEIYNGDKEIRLGRSYLSHVKVPLKDEKIQRLRFSVSSPPNSGILIDDMKVAPAKKQEIQTVEAVPFSLPALVGREASPVSKLKLSATGELEPIAVAEMSLKLHGLKPSDIEGMFVYHAAGSDQFKDAKRVHQFELASSAVEKVSLPSTALTLADGENFLWIAAKLDKACDIDGQVQVSCERIGLSNGSNLKPTPNGALEPQRLGVALRQGDDDEVHTYRIPGLATTKDGTLIGVYDVRHRNGGDLPGHIDVGMSRSTDGGRSWESMKIIADMGDDPKWRYDGVGDPTVLVDRTTGTIWVAGLWSHGNRGWFGSGPGTSPDQTGQFLLVRSDDDGKTWSKPINITEQIKQQDWCLLLQGPGKGITMTDGTLVFPAQYQDSKQNKRVPQSTIVYSRDHGETWQIGKGAYPDTTEAQVVEVTPGRLMLNCRYNRAGKRVVMTTDDLGETWQAHPTSIKALVEPGACQASLIDVNSELDVIQPNRAKSAEQRLLLFSNPNSSRGRNHITIKASLDDGLTWPVEHQLLLDEGSSAGYSCMSMIDEETVGILYEGSQSHMTFQRVKISDILRSGQ